MAKEFYVFGDFRLHPSRGLLLRGGESIALPPQPFLALELLLQGRGDVVSKATLIETIWPDSFVEDSSLTQCIFLLRRALGKTGAGLDVIETVPRRGYRIAIPVEAHAEDAGSSAAFQPVPEPVRPPGVHPEVPPPKLLWRLTPVAIGLTLAAILFAFYRNGTLAHRASVVRFTRLTNDGAYKERLISLLTDGSRIFFSEDVDARSYLAEVPVTGGETIRLPAPHPSDSALAYNPAANEILFGTLWEQAEHGFSAMSLAGNAVRPLGDLNGHAASWSPDGSRVVYIRGVDILVANSDGSLPHRVAHLGVPPFWPRWSPDGSRIRFSMQQFTQNIGVWEMHADGSHLHPLFADEPWAREACCGDWTPDGRYYIFVLDESRRSSLWIAPDHSSFWRSGRPYQLAEGPADFWLAPLPARDGRHVYALGEQARGELIRFDPATRQFAPYLNGLSTDTLSFSRDGKWMAWTAYPEGTLWRSRVDGSERLRLTDPGPVARFPQWSPDGSRVTYIASGPDNVWHIYLLPSRGGTPRRLVADDTNQGVPTWSADGRRLVFGQIVSYGVGQKNSRLRLLDLKSGAMAPVPNSAGLWRARWSPTGDLISAVTADNRRMMLYDVASSSWTELPAGVPVNDCAWSHDGQYLYFDSTAEPVLYRYSVRTHQLEQYASLRGIRRTGFFGWSINLAPDDTPILLREAGIHELYSLELNF